MKSEKKRYNRIFYEFYYKTVNFNIEKEHKLLLKSFASFSSRHCSLFTWTNTKILFEYLKFEIVHAHLDCIYCVQNCKSKCMRSCMI